MAGIRKMAAPTLSGASRAIRSRYSDSGHAGKLIMSPSSCGGGGVLKSPASARGSIQSGVSSLEKK